MGFRCGTIAALGLILALPSAWASAADAPATRPAHTEENDSPVNEIVPKLDVDGTRLGDFVTLLADQWKDMQIVQFNGPWQDLTLPSLHLRNVTREQVLTLLSNIYPMLYIHPLDQHQPGLFGRADDQHGQTVLIFQQLPNSASPVPIRVLAFGLTQTVDRLAFHRMAVSAAAEPEAGANGKKVNQLNGRDKDAEQKALKDVLSLIQATLDQSAEPDITPTLMLHEPTETVLVKGTPAQIAAVTEAIKALDTSMSDNSTDTILFRQKEENEKLKEQLKSAETKESKLEAQLKAITEQQHKPGSKE